MYMAYVTLLEYCDSVWDNCPTVTKRQLDAINIEAARIISGATIQCRILDVRLSKSGEKSTELQNPPWSINLLIPLVTYTQ